MKITPESTINKIRKFLSNQNYTHIDMHEIYQIEGNIYDLVIYQDADNLLEDYIEFLYSNLEPVRDIQCCTIVMSEASLEMSYPKYIDKTGNPMDNIRLCINKIKRRYDAPGFKRLYMYDDGKSKRFSEFLDEIIYFSVLQNADNCLN